MYRVVYFCHFAGGCHRLGDIVALTLTLTLTLTPTLTPFLFLQEAITDCEEKAVVELFKIAHRHHPP